MLSGKTDPVIVPENDKMMLSTRYSATITLLPRLYKLNATVQYDKTLEALYLHLVTYFNCRFSAVAELTKNFNVHYHLTIEFIYKDLTKINVRKKFVDSFRKSDLFGFVDIRQIDDEPKWGQYISKSFKDFYKDTDRRPIIKDDLDYWDPELYASYGTEW